MTKKRIEWIDVAKGITIIFMIIGHTSTLPRQLIPLIYSFHMPLFIILSGMTYKIPQNKSDIKKNIKKNIKKLLIPYFIVILICIFIQFLKNNSLFNFELLIKEIVKQFLWGNGCSYMFLGHNFNGVGPIWFLITLFFSKILFDYINLNLKNNYNRMIIFSFILLLGIEIGALCWLPQGFDLVFVFVFYLYIGYWYQNEFKKIKVNKTTCFIAMFLIWTFCLGFKFNIEIAMRSYPYGLLCILQSLSASYCIIELCKFFTNIDILKKLFSNIGKLTLIILCIHSIEQCLIEWKNYEINVFIVCVFRVVLCILLSFLFNYVKNIIARHLKKCKL